jgi:hypothetical protein
MRRAASTLLLAGFAVFAPAHAADTTPGTLLGRVADLYVRHAGSSQLLMQATLAGAAARPDHAELQVTRPDGTRATLIARVPADLGPLAAGDEVEVERDDAVGARGAEFRVAHVVSTGGRSVAAPAGPVVVAENGRLFIRGGAPATGEAASPIARLLRDGPAPLKLARGGDAAEWQH